MLSKCHLVFCQRILTMEIAVVSFHGIEIYCHFLQDIISCLFSCLFQGNRHNITLDTSMMKFLHSQEVTVESTV